MVGAACGTGEVSKSKVESQIATQLSAQQPDLPKPTIVCPSGLKAKVGTKIQCVLTVEGDTTRLPVDVTVDSVKGNTVHFNVQVGTQPLP